MKPLGTITACFPHVDEETRRILQSVMDEAKDYNDFAELLCDKTITEPTPELTTYFAYFHAYNQLRFDLVRRLEDEAGESDLAKPYILLTRPWGKIDWDEFQRSISSALKVAPNDWLACQVYMLWRIDIGSTATYPEVQTELEALKILESKIESDEEFGFFRSQLYHINAREFMREGKIEDAKTWYDRAITSAKNHDNLNLLAVSLIDKANMIKNVNSNEALSILKSQRSISEMLGSPYSLGMNEMVIGYIAQARGEYETAINHLENCINYLDPIGLVSLVDFYRLYIARQYNQMQNGARALVIVNDVLEGYQTPSPWFPYIQQTRALLNLDRFDEAAQSLDLARDWVPKSGMDGLGEFPSAKFELEQAHSIFHSFPSTNQTLINLTHVEIEMFSYEKEKVKADISGPWMQALTEHVEERDIPGISAQAMLLKAKFQFKQGRTDKAKKLVKKVLKISETSTMKYLKGMAESLIPELIVS
ncbi:MAG: tetratricopeptide repeat protein [Candidatus Thorarchaeota archaeon]